MAIWTRRNQRISRGDSFCMLSRIISNSQTLCANLLLQRDPWVRPVENALLFWTSENLTVFFPEQQRHKWPRWALFMALLGYEEVLRFRLAPAWWLMMAGQKKNDGQRRTALQPGAHKKPCLTNKVFPCLPIPSLKGSKSWWSRDLEPSFESIGAHVQSRLCFNMSYFCVSCPSKMPTSLQGSTWWRKLFKIQALYTESLSVADISQKKKKTATQGKDGWYDSSMDFRGNPVVFLFSIFRSWAPD